MFLSRMNRSCWCFVVKCMTACTSWCAVLYVCVFVCVSFVLWVCVFTAIFLLLLSTTTRTSFCEVFVPRVSLCLCVCCMCLCVFVCLCV